MIKEFWERLSQREQSLIKYGSIPLVLVVGYFLLWLPLTEKVANLKQEVANQAELLNWMMPNLAKIRGVEAEHPIKKNLAGQSLLSVVDSSLKAAKLTGGSLSQLGKDSVQVEFKNTYFDPVAQWLEKLDQEYGIEVKQINIKRSAENSPELQISLALQVK